MSALADPDPQGKRTRALWTVSRGKLAIREESIGPKPEGAVFVRSVFSGVSRGTERLVFDGNVPESEWQTMRAPMQAGEFPFPVKYGYAAVGRVDDPASSLDGKFVLALHPHQDCFFADVTKLIPVPANIPPRRATLAPNMETALNGVWDSGAGPGDRIVIVGAGIVGCLVAALCAALPGAEVTLIDVLPSRGLLAETLGVNFSTPDTAPPQADLVFHTSASAAGLNTAVSCAGFESRIVEMSWYGRASPVVPLGGAFHSKRLQLISSQVGAVSPLRRPRWSYERRLAKALALLDHEKFDALLTHLVAFDDAAMLLPDLFDHSVDALGITITY